MDLYVSEGRALNKNVYTCFVKFAVYFIKALLTSRYHGRHPLPKRGCIRAFYSNLPDE